MRASSDVLLVIRSAGKVASPETEFIVGIREHIIVLSGVLETFLSQGVEVHARGGVLKLDVSVFGIETFNEFIHVNKVVLCIGVLEIFSHYN